MLSGRGGNDALIDFADGIRRRMCHYCVYSKDKSCVDKTGDCWEGVRGWLNATAESHLNDAIQNVIKDGAKAAIDIHEAAYAPDMNDGTMEDCVKQNGNHDTQTDLCKTDNTESEGRG